MKQDLIRSYAKAWETKDITLMKKVLTPESFGIRTFLENLHLSSDSLEQEMKDSSIVNYTIETISEQVNTATVSATLQCDTSIHIAIKFTFKDDTICKVYEVINDLDLKRLKCHVTYDGSRYNGFQRQLNQDTVQGTIESALKKITKEDIKIHASGRTDKGVHAINQVFHFDTKSRINSNSFYQLLNKFLPEAIHVLSSEEVSKTFHSRYDVKTKEYLYVFNLEHYDIIQKNYEWYPPKFDSEIFKEQLQKIEGNHNFQAFTKTNASPSFERVIYSTKIVFENGKMKVYIKGNGFLRYMIRYIIAALVLIASRKEGFTIDSLFESRDNSLLTSMAPSGGLYLFEVTYNE